MPSLPDTAVIIFLGLLLFGPKGLAQIARQLGKLMGEFRRASNEFRMQMEEELRVAEQADRQKEIAAIEAAAPPAPVMAAIPAGESPEDRTHLPSTDSAPTDSVMSAESASVPEPLPIASSGELSIMPPATGLPAPRSSSLAALIDAVPKMDPPSASNGAVTNGAAHDDDQRHTRYSDHDTSNGAGHQAAAEESLHG